MPKKIEYEIDEIQGTIRVKYKFDFVEPKECMNFPKGTPIEDIEEALKVRYEVLKKAQESPVTPQKKSLNW